MKINLNLPIATTMPPTQRPGAPAKGAGGVDSASVGSQDEARLSTGSQMVQGLQSQLQSVPEVRQQRVEALRASIAEGTYSISPLRIADTMLAQSTGKLG